VAVTFVLACTVLCSDQRVLPHDNHQHEAFSKSSMDFDQLGLEQTPCRSGNLATMLWR
jgi:hypothetical protein